MSQTWSFNAVLPSGRITGHSDQEIESGHISRRKLTQLVRHMATITCKQHDPKWLRQIQVATYFDAAC